MPMVSAFCYNSKYMLKRYINNSTAASGVPAQVSDAELLDAVVQRLSKPVNND
jgi:hypothetical protein